MSKEDKAEDSEEDSSAVCDCFDAVTEVKVLETDEDVVEGGLEEAMEVGVASEDDAAAPADVPVAAAEVEDVVDDDPEKEDEDKGAAVVRADEEESGTESVAMVGCGGCRVPVAVLIAFVSLFAIGEPGPGCSDSARDMYWSWRAGRRKQGKERRGEETGGRCGGGEVRKRRSSD